MPIVRVAQLDQSAGVRSRRSQVRFLSWTPFKALVPQQLQGGFRKPVWWPPAKARCESDQGPHFNGDHDVTAASRPVKAFVPVRIRLVTPISDRPKLIIYLQLRLNDRRSKRP